MASPKSQVFRVLLMCCCVAISRSLFASLWSTLPVTWETTNRAHTTTEQSDIPSRGDDSIPGTAMMLVTKPWWTERGQGRKCYFNQSMDALQKYWLPTNPYPIVLTHPDDWTDQERSDIRARWPNLTIHFTRTNMSAMQKPPAEELLEDHDRPLSNIAYKTMCAYKSYGFLQDPYLRDNAIDYLLHIDDDACLFEPIGYDVFAAMRKHHAVYAYKQLFRENTFVTRGLAEFAKNYVQRHHNGSYANPTLKQFLDNNTITDLDPRGGGTPEAPAVEQWAFSTNLEWMDLQEYRQPTIRNFLAAIEASHMIYHRRWGDAPIRFLLAYMFWNRNQVLKVCSAGYLHSVWPSSPRSCQNMSTDEAMFEIEDCIVHTIEAAKLRYYAD